MNLIIPCKLKALAKKVMLLFVLMVSLDIHELTFLEKNQIHLVFLNFYVFS